MNYNSLMLLTIISSVLYIAWVIMFFKFRHRFDGLLDDVNPKIFTLKEIYFIGLGVIEMYENMTKKRITDSEKAAAKLKDMSIIFGEESAEMYYYVYTSATISLVFTLVPLGMLIGCFMGSGLGLVCGALLVFALLYGVISGIKSAVEREKNSIIDEFPQMVSKLTMLINAGMLVRRAWDEVATSNYDYPIYREMRNTSQDMMEGMSVEEALGKFADRCAVKEIRKFSSIYVQAVNRGASESVNSMKIMADEAWEQKKQYAKQKGEAANQKLLIPNFIMFFGIILVVVVPIVISMFSGLNI